MTGEVQSARPARDQTRANVLVFNAGSASLKFELLSVETGNQRLDPSCIQLSAAIEGIGANALLSVLQGKNVVYQEKVRAYYYAEAARRSLQWLESSGKRGLPGIADLDVIGHRVVHGARRFTRPVQINDE